MSYENAAALLESYEKDIVKETIEQINIPSVSEDLSKTGEVKKSLETFMANAASYGFNTYMTASHSVGVVELGEGEEIIGILSHLDVVDPGALEQWERNPFSGTLEQGRIYGRGALDDKGATIVCLHVMRALRELKLPFYKKIQLIAGTGEEVSWTDIEEYINEGHKLPDYGFSPDNEFPVQNREKGYADFELYFDNFSGGTRKNGDFKIVSMKAGHGNAIVPEEAEAVLEGDSNTLAEILKKYDNPKLHLKGEGRATVVSASGRACHASVPDEGDNAIYTLIDFLSTLNLAPNGGYNAVRFIKDNLSQDPFGEALGLHEEDEYLQGEYVHKTTVIPTVIETTDQRIHLTLNTRPRNGTPKEKSVNLLNKASTEYGFRVELSQYYDPLFVSKDQPFIAEMAKAYEEVTGLKNEYRLSAGTTYAKTMNNLVSWGPMFPGDTDTCHIANEYIELDSLMKAARVYLKYLYRMAFSPDSGL
jgi:succinyl-diaminopimelate desuccinylase